MANKEQNDKELNDYLNGDSDLSKAYCASNKAEPDSHLDNAILSAARKAVNTSNNTSNKTQKIKPRFHKAPWVKPVSIAAIITLSVSLVVTMQQETGKPIISEPEVEMFDSAAVVDELNLPGSIQNNDASVLGEVELKQKKDERADTPTPASLGAAADLYRAEEKTEEAKARMKEAPARKMLLKEKSQIQADALEERAFADEQIMESAPTGIEFDDVFEQKQEHKTITKDKLEISKEFKACTSDSECIQIIDTCERCTCGSAINHIYLDSYLSRLRTVCENYEGPTCKYKCDPVELACIEGECKIKSDD